MKWLIIFSVLFSFSTGVFAGKCNDKYPSFTVNNKDIWQGATASEIFEKAEKKEIPKAKKINATGIKLGDLVRPYATKGTLLIKSCGGKSATFEIEDLLSDDKSKSLFFLAKTKKKTFKLLRVRNDKKPKADVKRIQTIELISHSVEKEKKNN